MIADIIARMLLEDDSNAEKLYKDNIGIAIKIAKEFSTRDHQYWFDMRDSALEALAKAAVKFDPNNGASFVNYAAAVIKNALRHAYHANKRRRNFTPNQSDVLHTTPDQDVYTANPERDPSAQNKTPEANELAPSDSAEYNDTMKHIEDFLNSDMVSQSEREAMRMHYVDDMSYRQISAVTGFSPTSVSNLLHSAIKKFKEYNKVPGRQE